MKSALALISYDRSLVIAAQVVSDHCSPELRPADRIIVHWSVIWRVINLAPLDSGRLKWVGVVVRLSGACGAMCFFCLRPRVA